MSAGEKRGRLRFEQRGFDDNGDRLGPWDAAGGFEASARIVALKGSETALGQRLAGSQPVAITVWSTPKTRLLTNAWRAVDLQSPDPAAPLVYNLTAVVRDERGRGVEILGVFSAGAPNG
jgi:hypothetical protein